MEENTNIKQIFIFAGIALGFLVVISLIAVWIGSRGASNSTSQSGGGDPMHQAAPAADETIFKSLQGKVAPDFDLTSFDGRQVKLSDYKGKKVVLFFSEGAMCSPSCWDQMKAFGNDAYFVNNDIAILTIVVDDKKTWEDATNQDAALKSVTVLLDTDKKVSQAYGALTVSSSMHRGEYPGHSYVILDKEEIVRETFDDPDMRVNNFELKEALNKIS